MTVLRSIARPMLASMFVVGGVNSLRHTDAMAPKVQPVADKVGPLVRRLAPAAPIPTNASTLIRANALVHLAAATALATGRVPRLSALVLAASLGPTTVAGHPFWNESDPQSRQNQTIHFFKNVSMCGGLLMASLDPDPGKKILPRRIKDKTVQAIDDLRT